MSNLKLVERELQDNCYVFEVCYFNANFGNIQVASKYLCEKLGEINYIFLAYSIETCTQLCHRNP